MASTYQLTAEGIPFTAVNQILVGLNNATVSNVVSIYRIWMENNQTSLLTGGQNYITLTRYTGGTIAAGNWILTPISQDTTNAAVPAGVVCSAKMTVTTPTTTELFRRIPWSNDEPTVSAGTIDEMEIIMPFSMIWDSAFPDANIEPLVLRPGQTLAILNVGFTATAPANAGIVDIFVEMTIA
jgi:hypothetical protein